MFDYLEKNKCIKNTVCILFFVSIGLFVSLQLFVTGVIDTDMLWHYKLGEEIIQTKKIIFDNHYTFLENTKWMQQEWLFDVIFYIICKYGGMIGFTLLYVCNRIFFLWITLKLNHTKHPVIYACVFSFLFQMFPMNRGNRPSEFSVYFVLCIVYLYWSESKYKYWLLFLLGIFLSNFHRGMIIIYACTFFLLIGLDLFVDVYKKTFSGKKYYTTKLKKCFVFLFGSLLNPVGPGYLFSEGIAVWMGNSVQISEWQPIKFDYLRAFIVLIMVFSYGWCLFKSKFSRCCVQRIGLLSAFLLLSLCSVKVWILYFVLWCVFGFDYMLQFLQDIFGYIFYQYALPENIATFPKITWFQCCCIGFCWYLCVFGMIFVQRDGSFLTGDFLDYTNSFTSEKILDYLKNVSEKDKDVHILTGYVQGNYLLANDIPTFVDTRYFPYGKEFGYSDAVDDLFYIRDVSDFDTKSITEFLDKYQFDYVWSTNGFRLDAYLQNSPDWECVLSDDITKDKDETQESEKLYEQNKSKLQYLYRRVG